MGKISFLICFVVLSIIGSQVECSKFALFGLKAFNRQLGKYNALISNADNSALETKVYFRCGNEKVSTETAKLRPKTSKILNFEVKLKLIKLISCFISIYFIFIRRFRNFWTPMNVRSKFLTRYQMARPVEAKTCSLKRFICITTPFT